MDGAQNLSDIPQNIVEFMRDGKERTTDAICAELALSYWDARHALDQLLENKVIRKNEVKGVRVWSMIDHRPQIEGMTGMEPIEEGEFNDSDVDLVACRHLWASRLLLILKDCFCTEAEFPKTDSTRWRPTTARLWLGSEDFYGTCRAAGFDPEAIEPEMRRRIALFDAGDRKAAWQGFTATRGKA